MNLIFYNIEDSKSNISLSQNSLVILNHNAIYLMVYLKKISLSDYLMRKGEKSIQGLRENRNSLFLKQKTLKNLFAPLEFDSIKTNRTSTQNEGPLSLRHCHCLVIVGL